MVIWRGLTQAQLNVVNKIVSEEMLAWAGLEVQERFHNQYLGSYWLLEFRESVGVVLKEHGEDKAREAARSEIEQGFPKA